ncbi:MAG: hypothetical protein NWF07_11735 [Candidatus Bathyarchaeota archaeon]|nr:hypothetical protein [Candidatus Bathyarchaeota archaeon]
MNKNKTLIGLLAAIAVIMGGIGFALAQDDTVASDDTILCDGTGVLGLVNGRGFWSQLTEEQSTQLATMTQEMLEAGETQEAIREMKATMLQEWGIDAPLWGGPYSGSQGPHGQQLRDGSGSGGQYGGRGSGNRGGSGSGYNGVCPN